MTGLVVIYNCDEVRVHLRECGEYSVNTVYLADCMACPLQAINQLNKGELIHIAINQLNKNINPCLCLQSGKRKRAEIKH